MLPMSPKRYQMYHGKYISYPFQSKITFTRREQGLIIFMIMQKHFGIYILSQKMDCKQRKVRKLGHLIGGSYS